MTGITGKFHLDAVRDYLKNRPLVSSAYLFGPIAKGVAKKNSDLDIAVLFVGDVSQLKRFEEKLEIAGDLESILKQAVDLVDLESADLYFIRQIMKHKLLIIDQDPERRVAFEVAKRRLCFDRQRFYETYHSQAINRLETQRRKLLHG